MTGHELAEALLRLPDFDVYQGEWTIIGAHVLVGTSHDTIELDAD